MSSCVAQASSDDDGPLWVGRGGATFFSGFKGSTTIGEGKADGEAADRGGILHLRQLDLDRPDMAAVRAV